MKIVIDARELRTSTGRYVERLLHYLQKIDKQNDYLVLLKPADFKIWEPRSPNFKKVASPYKEFSFSEQLGLLYQVWSLRADLVHFTMPQQPLFYFGRVVTNIHDLTTTRFSNPSKNWLIFKFKQWVYRVLIRVVAHKSKRIIAISEYSRQDIAAYARIKPSKITVTYPAADKIEAKPKPVKAVEGENFILYVGRALPHKNLNRLIDAFQELKWAYPDLLLVLAGKRDANHDLLERYVKNKKVTDVIFTDFVSDEQLRWLYEHAKAYVFPSLSEGFGLPGLEAMLYDLPVISSNATCLPEIYKDAALYFDPKSPKEMAERIKEVLDDPKRAQELASAGRKLTSQYSWEKMAKETLEEYLKILD